MEVNITKSMDVGLSGHGAGALGTWGSSDNNHLLGAGLNPLAVASGTTASLGGENGLVLGGLSQKTVQVGGMSIPAQGALLKAMQEQGIVNVLSAPNILTADNQKAEISVGENIPLQTNQYSDVSGKPVTSLSRQDIDLRLSVTPQINEGDEVTLEIEQEIKDIVKNPDVKFADVAYTKRTAKTTVIAENGQTIVIGGLIKDYDEKDVTKVPLLGDIPIIGYLFRQSTVKKEKINLMIFLTPHVIHEPLEHDAISVKKNSERQKFNKVHGVGENQALYDYDLDTGLNMAPPPASSGRQEVKPKQRFNFDQLDQPETKPSTSERGRRSTPSFQPDEETQDTVQTDFPEDDEDAPRPRRLPKAH